MPISWHARTMRTAISPRLAIKIFLNMRLTIVLNRLKLRCALLFHASFPCYHYEKHRQYQQLRFDRMPVTRGGKDKIISCGIGKDQSGEKPSCQPLLPQGTE